VVVELPPADGSVAPAAELIRALILLVIIHPAPPANLFGHIPATSSASAKVPAAAAAVRGEIVVPSPHRIPARHALPRRHRRGRQPSTGQESAPGKLRRPSGIRSSQRGRRGPRHRRRHAAHGLVEQALLGGALAGLVACVGEP
jgi:hypothetical protein